MYGIFSIASKKEEICVRQQMLKIMMDESKQINKKAAAIQE
jgi:hypothetical protein